VIEWVWAAALVLLFVVLLRAFGMVERSREVIGLSKASVDVIRDPALDDLAKEKTLQANALTLLGQFLVLTAAGAAALLIPAALLLGADRLGWASFDGVVNVSMSPLFLGVTGVLTLVALALPGGSDAAEVESDAYSSADRAVHRLAFRTRAAQLAMADVEDLVFRKRLSACEPGAPVFITALPRAGTTLLLDMFSHSPEFASHRYRDMPFLLVPLLWDAFSRRFRQEEQDRERAHGDGMRISPESPEALEEVVWLTFHRQRYAGDRIEPWSGTLDDEFVEFFRRHVRKVVLLRGEGRREGPRRYVSKNNLNIARTDALRRLFPEARIVVPFRDPVAHVDSLLRQHLNFLAIHEKDPFAREYMKEIGHFDFGDNLAPVDFDGWLDRRPSRDARSPDFWLEYWIASYHHLLGKRDHVVFVSYEDLCRDPASTMRALATSVGASDPNALVASSGRVHAPRARDVDLEDVSPDLLREARELHRELLALALG
jgi:hypothetical protein